MGVMTAIAVTGAVIGAAGGISKMIEGGKAKKQAKRALSNYKRQEFKNAHRGRTVSTKGAELAMEQNARNSAASLDNLAEGGIRGSVGGTGRVQEQSNDLSRIIGADLDEQRFGIDQQIAQEDVRIETMQEQREQSDINTMQAQLNAGAQTQASGLGDIGQSAFAAASIMNSAGVGQGVGGNGGQNVAQLNPNYNPQLGAANTSARTAFGDIGGALGSNLGVMNQPAPFQWNINQQTGLPYTN